MVGWWVALSRRGRSAKYDAAQHTPTATESSHRTNKRVEPATTEDSEGIAVASDCLLELN